MTTEETLAEWVRDHVAKVRDVVRESITLDQWFSSYGLDSVDAVVMAGELEEDFGIEIDPARFLACDSFGQLITTLAPDIDKAGERRVRS
ncbi:MAG TPA: acyl carrier protein [Candidatus Sulfotelmatobacter sp.]|nr:acyl carrier protein [Candidatus Sulfotelmatobacter sp.]